MDPSSEFQNPENYSPEQKQIQLKSVYEALPARSVMKDKFNDKLKQNSTSEPDPSKQGDLMIKTTEEHMKDSFSNELRNIKFGELKKLLSRSKISSELKNKIISEFEMGFGFGIEKKIEEDLEEGLFSIIGATNKSSIKEGIFSEDPAARLAIERKHLKSLDDAIVNARSTAQQALGDKDPKTVKRFTDKGIELQKRADTMRQELASIYSIPTDNHNI